MDASAIVASLVDDGSYGDWARAVLLDEDLLAPQHVFVEVSNALRRQVLAGWISRDVASLTHRELVQLPVALFPFLPLADRVWELHPTVTGHDAPYVALAEELQLPLITLDGRLARASGPRCTFRTPDLS